MTTRSAPGGASSVTFSYDAANRLSTRTVAGTSVTTFGYDNADRLTSVTAPGTLVTSYTYDNAGRTLTTTYPNGSVQTKAYSASAADLSYAITKTSGAVTLDSHAYTYKGDGRRLTETVTNGDVITYGYDNAGQLTSEGRTGTTTYSIAYTYDNAGNRATKVQGGVTDIYTYDNAEKLSSTSSKTYGYDDAGNVTSVVSGGVTTALTWDAEERLKTVSVGGVTTQTNTYNGLGQRTKKVEGANSFTFTLNDDAIDSDVLSDGAASYMQGAGGLIGETRGGTSKYYHADALGTTRAITNSGQSVTDSLDTDAFGINVTVSGAVNTPFRFAGQHGYQTDTTGLMRLGHRFYDASVGRFISRDPIQDGYNWYAYCNNDPANAVDPTGNKFVWWDIRTWFNNWGKGDPPTPTPTPTPSPTPTPTPDPDPPGKNRTTEQQRNIDLLDDAQRKAREKLLRDRDPNYPQPPLPDAGDWGKRTPRSLMEWTDDLAVSFGGHQICGQSCFVMGTPVVMADGSNKAIEEVRLGDRVLSRDKKTGKVRSAIVLQAMERAANASLVQLVLAGDEITLTNNHKVNVAGSSFIEAGRLRQKTDVITSHGHATLRQVIGLKSSNCRVYNLIVSECHTYFVGKSAICVEDAVGEGGNGAN